MQKLRSLRLLVALLCVPALVACRNSSASDPGSENVTLVPSGEAASGCSGPDQVFLPPQTPTPVGGLGAGFGPFSQVTAAGDSETLFVTTLDARVVAVDVSGMAAVETELVASGEVAALLATVGITTRPVLSGICVLDVATLLVCELTSNTILAVDRLQMNTVAFFAGVPNEAPGFADGPAAAGAGAARFSFDRPSQILATMPSVAQFVFVSDPGNHAIRRIQGGFVSTVAGTGSPFFGDGDLISDPVGFDTPTGVSVTCSGVLLVSETGASGEGGQRLRQITLGSLSFFGQAGSVITRAGDGTEATTQGQGALASLAAPVSPLATSGQDVYWVDSGTGILRRMRGPADTVDCPLWSDCAAAVSGGGDFTPMGPHSLTQTPAGLLFVLDATAGVMFRVTP